MFRPKLLTTLRGYDRHALAADVTAGVIVGIVALPLAIAFAIGSGVPPAAGLWTAIVAGFLISALGGSRVQIGGPTGAFVVIVAGIVQRHGIDGLQLATLMAGGMLIVFGLARFGGVIAFVPRPLVVGFTAGIAVVIFTGQLHDLLGLEIAALPSDVVGRLRAYADAAGTVDPVTATLGLATIALVLLWPSVSRRLPGPFVALVAGTAAASLLDLPVATIGTRFGALPTGWPTFALPSIPPEGLGILIGPAFTIALLGAVESLLSAVVADGMIGGRHRSNTELVAQGIANVASPLVGGIPATGAIARTATNVKNGGRTPIAGIVHALTLLLVTLVAGRWATAIPLAVLAGILVVVAWHMSEWRAVRSGLRAPGSDVLVLLAALLLTVLVDLTVAIEVGMVLAAFAFVKRMADASGVTRLADGDDPDPAAPRPPAGTDVYELEGPFFFGAVETFRNALGHVAGRPRRLVLRMRQVPMIDASGAHALDRLIRDARRDGTRVVLCEVAPKPLETLRRAGVVDLLGEGGIVADLEEALAGDP